MKTLHLAPTLAVPVDIATEAIAWVGARGSGKTHGAGKLVELLHGAGVPVVVLDPVGVWWGVRLDKDGKSRGLSIPVFGGLHGDVPLEPTAGALIADLICDKNLSAILDISQFETDSQKARFSADFIERLFMRRKRDPAIIHLVVEEAQEFIPQNPQPGEQMMLHRFHRYVKLGRVFGLGVSIVTQRPQEVSKKVLNQCQTVLAFRLTGPQERKAMKEWTSAHDLDQSLIEKLPKLETGNCHVWSPAFLKVSKEVRISAKTTFDASATPKFGERRAVRELTPIDIAQLRDAMAATIEKAKSDDPKALRAEIVALRKQVALGCTPDIRKETVRVEVPVLKESDIKRLERAMERGRNVHEALLAVAKVLDRYRVPAPEPPLRDIVNARPPRPAAVPAPRPVSAPSRSPVPATANGRLAPSHQRVVNALDWLAGLGVTNPARAQVAVLAGMTPNSGYYERVVGELKTSGMLTYPTPGLLALTSEGQGQAETSNMPKTNEDLHADSMRRLGPSHQKVLRQLLSAYPEAWTRETVAAATEMAPGSGYYERVVGELKTMGFVTYPERGYLRAADFMFPLEVA